MTIKITDSYLSQLAKAMAHSSEEQIKAYFEGLKLLPDGEEISEAVQAKMLEEFFGTLFPEQRSIPIILTKQMERELEEARLQEESNPTPLGLDSFAFYTEGSPVADKAAAEQQEKMDRVASAMQEETEEDCGDCDCCDGWVAVYLDEEEEDEDEEYGWITIENRLAAPTSELSSLIQSQTRQSSLSKMIQEAVQPVAEPEEEKLSDIIKREFSVKELARQISEQIKPETDTERLSRLIDETLVMLHGHSAEGEITNTWEEVVESILDEVINHSIEAGMFEGTGFSISSESIELYEFVFQAIYYDILMEQGYMDYPEFEYAPQFTAYILTGLARHAVEDKKFSLAFSADTHGQAFPILKAVN